jgi:hypothetical protein
MKLSDAAALCEGNSRAFAEVYKVYNYKDEDDLRAYCDFVVHEPVEWMRGFPAAWKSTGLFSKPRAAFHRLLKQSAVVEELGAEYCENVHSVVWGAFKTHMDAILEKRNKTVKSDSGPLLEVVETESVASAAESTSTGVTAESLDVEVIPPVPTVAIAPWPRNAGGGFTVSPMDYKHKYEVLHRVVETLLGGAENTVRKDGWFQAAAAAPTDENARLRAAFKLLLAEFSRV